MLSKPNIRPSAVCSLDILSINLLTYLTQFTSLTSLTILSERRPKLAMAFTFAAFSYIAALIIDAFLLFFSIFHVSSN